MGGIDGPKNGIPLPKNGIPLGNDDDVLRGLRARKSESLPNVLDVQGVVELEAPTVSVRVPRHGSETTSPPRNR